MRGMCVLSLLLLLPVGTMAGCPSVTTDPPAEAILAGSWKFDAPQAGLGGPTTIIFNADGQVDQVIIQTTETIQVLPKILQSSTTVAGTAVSFSLGMLVYGDLDFTGTLDPQAMVITGKLTSTENVVVATVVTDKGPATLTKLP